jgi:hypothetical protein
MSARVAISCPTEAETLIWKALKMFNPQSHDGEWWLPMSPNNRVRGTLTLEENNFTLQLHGLLLQQEIEPGQSHPIGNRVQSPLIYGRVEEDDVTLLDTATFSMRPLATVEIWYVRLAMFGDHVEPDSKYDQVRVVTEHLDDFAVTPFVSPEIEKDSAGDWQKVGLEISRIVVTTGDVPEVGSVEIVSEPDYRHGGRHGDLGLRGELRLTTVAPVTHDEAIEMAGKLRALVRLATGCPCATTVLTLRREDSGSLLRVLRLMAAIGRKPCERGSGIGRQLFTAANLPNGADTFDRWWHMVERYERGWTLLTVHDDGRYPNVGERLAGYARALEALHHADYGAPNLAEERQDERSKRVLAAVPDDLEAWVAALLQKSTPPQFRHRILEVLKYLGDSGLRLCGGNPEIFALAVTSTRNFITHPKVKEKGVIKDVQGQLWVGSALYWIGFCYLVKKLGMTDDELASAVQRVPSLFDVTHHMDSLFAPVSNA